MRWRDLPPNEKAAVFAAIAGALMLVSGFTGASQWHRTFDVLQDIFGQSTALRYLGVVFIALGSIGGLFVLLAAYMFQNDRVRTARIVIWFGTGFTILSLIVFALYQATRGGDFPFAGASLLGFVGVLISVVARFQSKKFPR